MDAPVTIPTNPQIDRHVEAQRHSTKEHSTPISRALPFSEFFNNIRHEQTSTET